MPRGMALWERLRGDFDRRFAATGVVNCYFPLLVPLSFFRKEAEHVEGFAKECAIVTHSRLNESLQPDEDARLAEPLVVRPTSETVVWDSVRKWVSTAADLPVLLNQWANVVRWERRTRPFLRTSEFLWQEGHTAHATRDEAWDRAVQMLAVYASCVREALALPVIMGTKSPSERFAGAEETLTIEAMMVDGWALQCGTSHFLGTSFGDAFGVRYEDGFGASQPVWATSWGVSTRLMGAMVMAHSDDTGFVAPPALAPVQVEVMPVSSGDASECVMRECESLVSALRNAGIRAELDTLVRDLSGGGKPGSSRQAAESGAKGSGMGRRSLGKRRYASERRGCPLRIEVGRKEVEAGVAVAKPRVALSRAALRASVEEARAANSGDADTRASFEDCEEGLLTVPSSPTPKLAGSSRSTHPSDVLSVRPPVTHLMTDADPASLHHATGDSASLAVRVLNGLAQDTSQEAQAPLRIPLHKPAEAVAAVRAGLQAVHATLLHTAEVRQRERTVWVASKPELERLAKALDREEAAAAQLDGPAFMLAPWHDCAETEASVKAATKLTIRCFPAGDQAKATGLSCVWTGRPATHVALFARAY